MTGPMRRTETALLIVLAATWGAVYPLTTIALRHVTPEAVVFWRTAAAAAVLAPVALRPRVLAAVKKRWRDVLVAAGLQATVPLVLLTFGQQHVSASVAGVISGAQPVMVALLAVAVPGARHPGLRELAGIAAGAAGVVLLFARSLGGHTQLTGGLLVLGSAIFFALGAVWIDARLSDVPPLATATTAVTASAVALLPFAIISGGSYRSLPVVADLAALGAVGTGAALVLFYTLIQHSGAARAGLGFLLAPAFAVIYGATLLSEKLTSEIIAGLVLITGGSLLTLHTRSRPGDHSPAT
jgi:drug/metabolite transporter (DMT)-like permease